MSKSEMPKYSRAVVTGGAGFIGSHLVDELLRRGIDITVLDNLESGKLENIRKHMGRKGFCFIRGDIRDRQVVKEMIKDVDVVVHLAALTSVPQSFEYPSLYNEVNVVGTLNLLEASLNSDVKLFVYASSCAVYGNPKMPPIKESHILRPNSPYAITKMTAESYMQLYYEEFGLSTVCLRYFNVYGPRQFHNQYAGVIVRFLECIKKNKPLVVFGDGRQTRDFVHVKDLVEAHMLVIKNDVGGETFNVGTGTATTINELADMLVEVTKNTSPKIVHTKPRKGDIRQSVADISKAKEKLQYLPKVSLREGLKDLARIQTIHLRKDIKL